MSDKPVAATDTIRAIASQIHQAYQAEYDQLVRTIAVASDPLQLEDLNEARAAFELVLHELENIHDVLTADRALGTLNAALKGSQPATRFMVLANAKEAITEHLLAPVRIKVDPATAFESAIAFLKSEMPDHVRQQVLADITTIGLKEWSLARHISFGMGVRNRLREVGYDEEALGVDTLDEVWANLVYKAVQ